MTEKRLTYYKGRYKNPKWIHYNKKTRKYAINRTIHNFLTYFGSYDTLEEAEEVVKFLNENDWDKDKLKEWKKMTEEYKVTVNDLYLELQKLIENGDGDKPIKLSVNWDKCDHLQNLRAFSTDYTGWLLLMGYD